MKIRNYIIRLWNSDKERYVTKTSIRKGLADCGDVNAIGRIHQFLELIGAINFGLEAPSSCRKQGQIDAVVQNETTIQQVLELIMSCKSSTTSSPFAPTCSNKLKHVQFDPSFDLIKSATQIQNLSISSNALMVMDLHAHVHKRDGFGLLAGQWDPENNNVKLLFTIPYTGPQSSSTSSLQSVSFWEKSVINWVDHSEISQTLSNNNLPLEILGYYTTHKLNSLISLSQFSHYRSIFCKNQSKTKPFIGAFAVPFTRKQDLTSFSFVMYPLFGSGSTRKTLHLLKTHVLIESILPIEQFVQILSSYHKNNEDSVTLFENDIVDPHRTLFDRLLISLSSFVYVSEKTKNSFWEQIKIWANKGISDNLIDAFNTKEVVWRLKPKASQNPELNFFYNSS